MVQVDVFWAYGLGAGFAMAASRQIRKIQTSTNRSDSDSAELKSVGTPKNSELIPFWKTTYFLVNVLFLSLIFGPSGLYLVWQFTSWETMQVLDKSMPGWLVTLFGFTNVSQGILAFWVVWKLLERSKFFLGFLQVVFGYFGMFFILVHGWDGEGYKRFFSATKEQFLHDWSWNTALSWLTSDVAITLYVMGLIMIPVLISVLSRWLEQGLEIRDVSMGTERKEGKGTPVYRILFFLGSIFIGTLGLAILCSLTIHAAGWIFGTVLGIAIFYILGISKYGILFFFYKGIFHLNGSPVSEKGIPLNAGI
ncbi:hypothetical protein CH379_000495 [Leptospira ellisii]|uniref:Uncharacterized protein n=1 Tax=Leptospira ellisii TaxID=2023197 RepID=A0A2N0B6V8_9LEPT|nr:hypothetical protein [Leptospira ellisii]MDV6234111.1 hypothetical protein [Leptospira ellisii]PJZ92253.1 hypothetical protein CH379_14190 [Leptospira ellisii]PKA03693.1 hypothetical protein CH375_15455 [Leptospira ellisii]